jgi:hypothetical protein
MWNENTSLDYLNNLPLDLNAQNEAEIQMVIDQHKYENSEELNCDLCGYYAPFCQVCDKSVNFPCARAYLASKQKEVDSVEVTTSLPVEMEQTDDGDVVPPEQKVIEVEITDESETNVAEDTKKAEEQTVEQQSEVPAQDDSSLSIPEEKKAEEKPQSERPKKIRIAVARRKKGN